MSEVRAVYSMSIGTLRKGNDLPMYHILETSEFGDSRKICGAQMCFVTCGCSYLPAVEIWIRKYLDVMIGILARLF